MTPSAFTSPASTPRPSSSAPRPATSTSTARPHRGRRSSGGRLRAMEFTLSPRTEELRDRIRSFLDEHVFPVEKEALQALDDEVRPGVAYPQILVEIRAKAREEGLWNLFI